VVTMRPFNTYGPRQSARAVIPTIIAQVLTGSTVKIGSLETRRDFTYVMDTVAGFLRCGEVAGIEGQTFNLGTGTENRVGEIVEKVMRMSGKKIEVVMDAERLRPGKSEVMRLLADNSKAKQILGWAPQVGLDEGLALTYAWIKAHLELYHPERYQR